MGDAFDQLGNQPQTTQTVAQPPAGGGDAFDQLPKDATQPVPVPHYTDPKTAATMQAVTPSIFDRIENMFRYANPNTRPNIQEEDKAANRSGSMQLVRPEELMTASEQKNHPMATAIGQASGSMTTPESLAIMAMLPVAGPMAVRLASAGFGAQALKAAYDTYPEIKAAFDRGDESEVERLVTHATLDLGMAAMTAKHVASGEPYVKGKATQFEKAVADRVASPEARQGFANYEAKTDEINNPHAPKADPKLPAFRPHDKTIAGVTAKESALQQENPSLVTRTMGHFTSQEAANNFQEGQAADYTKQAVSTVGQRVEDRVASHDALVNGQPEPDQITGTDTVSKHDTLDDMHNAMRKSSEQTYQKADVEDRKDIAAWEQEVAKAQADYKDSVARHNQNIADYNATEEGKKNPMEPEAYNPEDAKVPEKPDTYAQMKSDLQAAQANAQSADPVIRQKAFEVEIPKANKAIDKWFSDHSDAISDPEYQSAKRLRADSEKVKTMAQMLRQPILDGNMSSGKMSSVEAAINKKSVRGGFSENAFANLLGPEGYQNWNDVKDLFKPIAAGSGDSWGTRTLAYIAQNLIGHLVGLPGALTGTGGIGTALATSRGMEWFSNKVMFDPEFGSWFKDATNAMKSARGAVFSLPGELRNRFVSLMDKVKAKGSRGTVGADVPQGNEPITNKPFGRSGLGGSAAADAAASDQAAQMKAQSDAQAAASKPEPQVGFNMEHGTPDADGVAHHTMSIDKGDEHLGLLNIEQQTPDSWTIKDAALKADARGKGLGPQAYEQAFQKAAEAGMKTVESDISNTTAAQSVWEKLKAKYPAAITEENGQYTADLSKLNGPQEAPPTPKAPQESTGPGHNPDLEISTRDAGANNPTEHVTGWDAIEQAEKAKPGHIKKLLNEVMKYPDLGIKLSEDDIANPRQGLEKVVNQWAQNLEWLHNKVPASIRNISKLWYDSANKMANGWADTYNVTKQQAAGVIAALSPKNPWDINAGQGKRMMDMWTNQRGHEWSPEMETELNRSIEKIEPKIDKKTGKVKIDPKTGKPPVDAYKEGLQSIRGKTFAELEDPTNPKTSAYRQALWFRMLDVAHGSKMTELYAPDGSIRGHIKFNWGMPEPMAKAVQMLKSDGSTDAIHQIIGDGHKIRNFYNNIASPNSPNGHATIDTHAGNADMLAPRGSNDPEVTGIFGGAPSHAETGQSGMYSLHHEAYRRAAANLDILPRELQSITWEGVKSLMGDDKKTPALKQAISEVWQKHLGGELTIDGARNAIVKAANGFTRPPWMNK
jgi:GNAT superfamily N-acetyltransferase